MLKIKRRSILMSSAAIMATSAVSKRADAQAAGESFTPDDLKSKLTPLGGLRAGNAEGTIPAWTGELIPLPADYVPGAIRPDPFADEKPVLSINSTNMAAYQDKLPAGALYLMKTYPNFRVDVYPTHRTAIAPQYVYDYTYKNATHAQISADGNSISGAYGGVPFPIPTTGKEIMWNHLLVWKGTTVEYPSGTLSVTSAGQVVVRGISSIKVQYPYYFEDGEAAFKGFSQELFITVSGPPYQDGQAELLLEPINPVQTPPRAWAYLPGQRRTRLAPQLEYDTPVDIAGGVVNWDETQMFYGPLDEYDVKIVGKKEMYIPYNSNRAYASTFKTQFSPNFYNPDVNRWELHRVWVVEMTLAPGKRNVDARRVYYIDEDTWGAVGCDIYDASGALWKYLFPLSAYLADIPCVLSAVYVIAYDFHAGDYAALNIIGADAPVQWKPIPRIPDIFFTPGELSALAGGN